MVVFTCNNCGDSVKKPAVEKHFNTKCRGNVINVSCMDCQKDFHGNEHVAHTKCITEAEKYSAKGFVAKATKNTNSKKQDSWTNVVRSILESSEYKMNARTREAFQKLANFENVPRKKVKFENYATKCIRFPKPIVNDVWNILEKEIKKMEEERRIELEEKKLALANDRKSKTAETTEADKSNGAKRSNDDNEHSAEPAKKKKKKQKDQANENETPISEEQAEQDADASEEFKWEEVLTKITQKNYEGIALEKLKNKTLKKYKAKLGVDEMTEKQQKKFTKKFTKHLKKFTNIVIENDVAKIV